MRTEFNRAPLTPKELLTKRVLDLLLAVTALVILSPLLAVICLSIKLEGRSRTILRQRRMAFNGREFSIYEFTTIAPEDERNSQAGRNNTRVTRVGRLLQLTSMEKIPSLFSALGGQMSLAGPSPSPVDVEDGFSESIAYYASQRHIRPGLIGWAQVNGLPRDTGPVEQRNQWIELERWYIENWSIWLDLQILLRACIFCARRNAQAVPSR